MLIQSYLHPNLSVVRDVRALEAVCHAHDGLSGTLFLDPSLNFSPELPCLFTLREGEETVSRLTFFVPTQAEAELVGMTHPAHRGKGYFRALVRAAAEFARKYGVPICFLSASRTRPQASSRFLVRRQLDHTEYSLRYNPCKPIARLTVLRVGAARGDRATSATCPPWPAPTFSDVRGASASFLVKSLEAPDGRSIRPLNGETRRVGRNGLEDGDSDHLRGLP